MAAPTPENKDFARISPTAFMTCLARQFSGIPYSRQIAEKTLIQRSPYLPLLVESRYKAIDQAARSRGCSQVLELASGFLPRGLEMTDAPGTLFIESDLPDVIKAKRELCSGIAGARPNLRFAELDATAAPAKYLEAASDLDPAKEVLVLCEGLLMYLSHQEKAAVCAGVSALLRRHGGAWITTDFTPGVGRGAAAAKLTERLQTATGRSLADNSFEHLAAALAFIKERGFEAVSTNLLPLLPEMKSLQAAPLPDPTVKKLMSAHRVFTLTLPA